MPNLEFSGLADVVQGEVFRGSSLRLLREVGSGKTSRKGAEAQKERQRLQRHDLISAALLTLVLDQRLGFDDRMLVREGVEGGENQAAGPRLGRDEAERRQRQAVVGGEIVRQARLYAAGPGFVMRVQEGLPRQHIPP